MFTPSLTTAIVHAAMRRIVVPEESWGTTTALLRYLRSQLKTTAGPWPLLPILARTNHPKEQEILGPLQYRVRDGDEGDPTPPYYFWGRVPVDHLLEYVERRGDVSPKDEVLDLGLPLRGSGSTVASNDAEGTCRRLLAKTAKAGTEACVVGLVDSGVHAPGRTPDVFGGALTHLITQDVVMSPHALRVLAVLLEQLEHRGVLASVHVVFALVRPGPDPLQVTPFEFGNAPEMLTALQSLFDYAAQRPVPSSLNLSMGTHVGPHNGASPLEQFVSEASNGGCVLHVSGGNDGFRGIHAVRTVLSGSGEDLLLQTGLAGEDFLLTEMWWNEECGSLSAEVDVVGPDGKSILSAPVRINASQSGAVLAPYRPADPRLTLIANRCYGSMSCLAFGMTPSQWSDLRGLQIRFALESNKHAPVHSWIVNSKDDRTTFVGATHDATLRVPATAANVIGVAGAIDDQRAWPQSSRGVQRDHPDGPPTNACHDLYWPDHLAPLIAHRVQFGSGIDLGTSYASPRACADTAAFLIAHRGLLPGSVEAIVESVLGRPLESWNPRTGFGIMRS